MKYLFILGFISLIWGNNMNNSDCSKFHEGSFKNIDKKSGTTYITRKNSIQTEINNDIGYSVKLKVEWLSDCKYTLQLIEVLENRPKIPFDSSLIMTVEIIRIKENSYFQKTTSNKSDFVYESEIFVIDSKNNVP